MTPTFPSLSPDTPFSTFQTWTRQHLEKEVERCAAQTEAALDLLARAQEGGHELAFWQDALEHAESEEAIARRAFSMWQRDGKDAEAQRRSGARSVFAARSVRRPAGAWRWAKSPDDQKLRSGAEPKPTTEINQHYELLKRHFRTERALPTADSRRNSDTNCCRTRSVLPGRFGRLVQL